MFKTKKSNLKQVNHLNSFFSKEKLQMTKKYLEKFCLVIKEMQIKTTIRYHLTSVGMAIIKETKNNKCW
jgi:hypothetical protein